MNDDDALLTIGELARASGLSISALRFYDRQGILVPVEVDANSGYRWYAPAQRDEARLLARLRGIGLPLPEISTILARGTSEVTDKILADHIRGLESALEAARAQVSILSSQPVSTDPRSSGTPESFEAVLPGADLLSGIGTVRHAVGDDPDLPAIHGIHLVAGSRGLRLTATDRYRVAFAEVPARNIGSIRALLTTADADQLLELGNRAGDTQVHLNGRRLTLRDADGRRVHETHLLDVAFPDLSHAIPAVRDTALIHVEELIEMLNADTDADLWALTRGSGAPGVILEPVTVAGQSVQGVVVDRAYLRDALAGLADQHGTDRGNTGQLRFDFDGSADPVAIRRAEDLGTFAVVLPVIPDRR